MLPYCSSGSHDSKVEDFVRKFLVCFFWGDGVLKLGGNFGGTNFTTAGVLERGDGKGILLGLPDRCWSGWEVFEHRDIPASRAVMDEVLLSRCCRLSKGDCSAIMWALRLSFLGIYTDPVLLGAREIARSGAMGTIRLGPSCNNPPRVPKDVAGLAAACLPLSLANDDFGRARLVVVGGRIPLFTLAEKGLGAIAEDVLLEKLMLVRYDWHDGFREWVAEVVEGLAVEYDLGPGRIDLAGSAARSINVFLFGAGSGTAAHQND